VIEGIEAFKQAVMGFIKGFPDVQLIIEDMVAEGDKVTGRLTNDFGTHQGEFAGIPATGNAVTFTSIATWRFADGKIAEARLMPDVLGVMQQLGVIPPMPDFPMPALNRNAEDYLWGEPSEVTGAPGNPGANSKQGPRPP